MKFPAKLFLGGAIAWLGGCAMHDQTTVAKDGTSDAAEAAAAPAVGSHIRGQARSQPTTRMSGEDFQRANAAARTDPTADEILTKRN